jgi:hypothetical protein
LIKKSPRHMMGLRGQSWLRAAAMNRRKCRRRRATAGAGRREDLQSPHFYQPYAKAAQTCQLNYLGHHSLPSATASWSDLTIAYDILLGASERQGAYACSLLTAALLQML